MAEKWMAKYRGPVETEHVVFVNPISAILFFPQIAP
jgi:hypothetical protein